MLNDDDLTKAKLTITQATELRQCAIDAFEERMRLYTQSAPNNGKSIKASNSASYHPQSTGHVAIENSDPKCVGRYKDDTTPHPHSPTL